MLLSRIFTRGLDGTPKPNKATHQRSRSITTTQWPSATKPFSSSFAGTHRAPRICIARRWKCRRITRQLSTTTGACSRRRWETWTGQHRCTAKCWPGNRTTSSVSVTTRFWRWTTGETCLPRRLSSNALCRWIPTTRRRCSTTPTLSETRQRPTRQRRSKCTRVRCGWIHRMRRLCARLRGLNATRWATEKAPRSFCASRLPLTLRTT
mmetsp:Transcript_18208/g.43931  ORF Transcript_18208/g.43931 Transcript_18208/m.43931 type:complete len:208 (-) Transcript_18208:499-1122(-)